MFLLERLVTIQSNSTAIRQATNSDVAFNNTV